MRRSTPLRLLAAAFVAAFAVSHVAIAADDDDKDDNATPAEKAEARMPQPVIVGSLIRRTVLEPIESQPILGRVNAIVRSSDGAIKAVVAYGGFLGFGSRPIAVPLEAMALLGEYMEIVDFTPDQLKDFPTFDPAGSKPLPANETIKVGLAKPSH